MNTRRSQNIQQERERLLRRCESLATLLDAKFGIPGTPWRIGIDGLLGLIPGIGDLLGVVLGFYVVYVALVLKAPVRVIVQMLLNLLLDWAGGLVPLLGDLFDFYWKANTRNVMLLRRTINSQEYV